MMMSTFFGKEVKKMSNKANLDLRQAMKEANIKQWQIADLMGYSEATLVRKLRKELPEEEKQVILQAIKNKKEE